MKLKLEKSVFSVNSSREAIIHLLQEALACVAGGICERASGGATIFAGEIPRATQAKKALHRSPEFFLQPAKIGPE